ncbi:unnamed protein product [Cunninghamella blakesleeana]
MHRLSILKPVISYSIKKQAPVFIKRSIPSVILSRQQQQPFSTFGSLYTKQHDNNIHINKTEKEDLGEEEEEIEEINPKDYPELYPDEQDEEIDTEWFVDKEFVQEEDFIPLWQKQATEQNEKDIQKKLKTDQRERMKEISEQLMKEDGILSPQTIEQLLDDLKMDHIKVLDIRDKCDWTSYMIIAESHKGDRFLTNVAEQFTSTIRKAITSNDLQLPPPHIEGRDDDSGWLLIDLGHCIIHLFTPEIRAKYDLEGLWKSVPTDPSLPMPEEESDK